MKKILLSLLLLSVLGACVRNKDNDNTAGNTPAAIEQAVTEDFGNNIAMPVYADLQAAASDLNTKIGALVASPDDAGLTAAQTAWRNMRAVWELSEGFLFGPVEDNDYDPQTDTWPTDYAQMDSLLASNNALQAEDVQLLDYSLRGYHPIEYMLWGRGSNKTAGALTNRQLLYLSALSTDLQSICTSLQAAWTESYLAQVTTAGRGSTQFTTYQNFFTTLNNGMIDICNEVGKTDEGEEGKIYTPFIARDSSLVESPYSENSMTDFRNNITGAYNVYLGKYKTQQTGITSLVQLYNRDLDNRIRQKFETAINAFSNINVPFEKAIFQQRDQLQLLMNAIADVRTILQTDLQNFIITNIKN